ncbi:hypothetical protein [Parabacteroides bouchesdurhonensis]|uniref:hypothetical protein n=1 Tax=Parabacteroides bouchesdurhonensis TaxID=1936995 RepID=UPI000C854305|nr:hypothetical protein [Parabacteroides bouchesdurhonensis]
MKNYILCLFFFSFCFACDSGKQQKNLDIITFNVIQKYELKKIDIHDIAEIEYIVPVAKDSFLYTNFVYMTDHYFVMFNYFGGDFVFLDRQGNPQSSISKMGQGPTEYLPYYWLQVYDEDRDELFVFSIPNVLKVYDRFGKYKRTLPLRNREKIPCSIDAFYNYNEEYLVCHDKLSESCPFYLLSKKDGKTKDIDIYRAKKFDSQIVKDYGDENTMNVFLSNSYAIKEGDNILLTEYGTDTIFAYTPDSRLLPVFVRTPSIHDMEPQIVVHGFIEADHYLFFSTQKKEYDFQARKGMEQQGYMYDKLAEKYYEVEVYNPDYNDQILIVTPAEMMTRIGECSSNPHTGIRVLWKEDLEKADEAGKLSGNLKHAFDKMGDEDLFILMVLKFKQSDYK